MHHGDKECSQALVVSLSEKGNDRSRMASVETPLSFNVLHNSKKTEKCKFRFSEGVPPNWDCCTIEMKADLNSKLFASTLGWAMLQTIPWTLEVTKSLSILLWSPPPPAIFVEVLLVSRLCSSIFCFFLLKRKLLLITGSGSYRNELRINGEDNCKYNHKYYQCNQTINRKENKRK